MISIHTSTATPSSYQCRPDRTGLPGSQRRPKPLLQITPCTAQAQLPSCGQSKYAVQTDLYSSSTHQIDKSKGRMHGIYYLQSYSSPKYGIMMLVNDQIKTGQPQLISTTIWYHDACKLFQSTNAWQIQPSLPTQLKIHTQNASKGSSQFFLLGVI